MTLPSQSTSHVLLVKPQQFYCNPQTQATNAFQQASTGVSIEQVTRQMEAEFEVFALLLLKHGITVTVLLGPEGSPDCLFPNNIFSTHSEEESPALVFYPMLAANRQAELTPGLQAWLEARAVAKRWEGETLNLRVCASKEGVSKGEGSFPQGILEGTGSLVLDRVNRVAYVCLSPRAELALTQAWASAMGYKLVVFEAHDAGQAIYHTNVVMYVGSELAGVCFECMAEADRPKVRESLESTGHTVLELSLEQLRRMVGNALEVQSVLGERFLVMSSQAYKALTPEQTSLIERFYSKVLHSPLWTIEAHGGGSARCMLAELF